MKCVLSTTGYRFELRQADPVKCREGWAEFASALMLDEDLSGSLSASAVIYTPVTDLHRLAAYLTGYIAAVRASSDTVDPGDYVTIDLALRLTIGGGAAFGDGDAEAVVAVAVNVGAGERRVYASAEAPASFANLARFATELRELSSQMA